jgi:NADPH:quinone reductase-like Zn-dependent oxidoreductase
MCQFPRLPSIAYVFSNERRRITGAGLPHSEIRGSMPVQRLTAAYRSRPRPSSAPGAKASTVCPYYLDGEISTFSRRGVNAEVHGRPKAAVGRYPFTFTWVQFSSSAEVGWRGTPAWRSLKTEQR